MPEATEIERELKGLEAELRQLEAEYNMYFAGRLPRPPVETQRRCVESIGCTSGTRPIGSAS